MVLAFPSLNHIVLNNVVLSIWCSSIKRYSIIRVYNNFVLRFYYILLNVTTSCVEEIDTNKQLNIVGRMVCQSIQNTPVANSVDPVLYTENSS